MRVLVLDNLFDNTSSVEQGMILYFELKKSFEKKEQILLDVGSNLLMSSSFLNTSIGAFLDDFGIEEFKKTVKFKGSKSQFERIGKYIKSYQNLYLA